MKKADLKEGINYYINKQGYIVLTEKYHLEKGFCCGMGCLRCPYHFENVPEPRRFWLLDPKINKQNNSPFLFG